MKPIPLFDYQIKNNTKGGDIVLDLFGGSGTTIMACEQNGRMSGSYFMGQFVNNIPEGFGVYENITQAVKGYLDKDNMNRIGLEIWSDGTYY